MDTVTIIRKNIKNKEQKSKRVNNVLKLLYLLLIRDNHDIEYYSEIIGCKKATIKKYLNDIKMTYDAVERSGFEVNYNRLHNKYELFTDIKFTAFTPEEIESLHMAIKYLTKHQGSIFDNLKEIENKLQKVFTKEIRDKLKKPVEISGPDTKSKLKEHIDVIDKAINEKNKLLLDYRPTYHNETVKREIVPLSLLNYDYEWYVRAFCLKDRKIKTFAVNQIEKIEMKHLPELQKKIVPDKLPHQEHMWDWCEDDCASEEIVIRFKGHMGERMKKKLSYRIEHKSQKITPGENFTDVSFCVKNSTNMVSWILQFGPSAEVIKPEELRVKLKDSLKAMIDVYS